MNFKLLPLISRRSSTLFSTIVRFNNRSFYRRIKIFILVANLVFFIASICIPADVVFAQQNCSSPSQGASHECQKPEDPLQKKLSPQEFAGLTASMVLSPGIGLLKVAHNASKQGHDFGFIGWSAMIMIAIIDFIADKVAFISAVQQWAQHLIIWGTAYLASMYLGDGSNVGVLILVASIFQLLRQCGSFVIDFSIIGAPIRSTIEDIIALLIPI
jgi:hypothetical protein